MDFAGLVGNGNTLRRVCEGRYTSSQPQHHRSHQAHRRKSRSPETSGRGTRPAAYFTPGGLYRIWLSIVRQQWVRSVLILLSHSDRPQRTCLCILTLVLPADYTTTVSARNLETNSDIGVGKLTWLGASRKAIWLITYVHNYPNALAMVCSVLSFIPER
jgi:hypothetical protein